MTLDELKKAAAAENRPFMEEFYKTLDITCAQDIKVPAHILAEEFVLWCDRQKFPAYHVTDNYISMAPTYTELYHHENRR